MQGVTHVVQLVTYQANKEHVRIIFRHDADKDIMHFGAAFKFQEIIINLLLNAIESYEGLLPDDGRARTVEITIEEHGGEAVLRVKDNGCSMTPAVRARIFEPFFTTKDASKGIGIGLATIKKIIEKDLLGTIAVESEPGVGSTFTVTFPITHEELSNDDRSRTQTHSEPTVP